MKNNNGCFTIFLYFIFLPIVILWILLKTLIDQAKKY